MNRPQVAIGLAIIILSLIFFYSVLILLFLDALISIAVVLLIFGLGVPGKLSGSPGQNSRHAGLSQLDMVVLQMLSQNKSQDDIAKSTGVSPTILAEKCATLMSTGYVSGNYLTEKGFDALRNANPRTSGQ